MYYTYLLESLKKPDEKYIGHTSDLKKRLQEHNSGKCVHTNKFKPWKLSVYVAFKTPIQAQRFERYLKSGSGHAFIKRHFLA
jgi:putative endonuclease